MRIFERLGKWLDERHKRRCRATSARIKSAEEKRLASLVDERDAEIANLHEEMERVRLEMNADITARDNEIERLDSLQKLQAFEIKTLSAIIGRHQRVALAEQKGMVLDDSLNIVGIADEDQDHVQSA